MWPPTQIQGDQLASGAEEAAGDTALQTDTVQVDACQFSLQQNTTNLKLNFSFRYARCAG
jgi:hypothetical protein